MFILLVLLMFSLCLFFEWVLSRKEGHPVGAPETRSPEIRPIHLSDSVSIAGIKMQKEVAFHPGHAWALEEGPGRTRVGVDDFALKLIGKIDGIDLPKIGDRVVQGRVGWVLHHDSREAPMLSPVTGTVVAVNPLLLENREVIGTAPYTDGWLFSVRSNDVRTNFNNLLRGDLPRKWMEGISARLRKRLKLGVAVSFAGRGEAIDEVCSKVDDDQWKDIVHEFLLT